MADKERSALTEAMFYTLMAFTKGDMCGTAAAAFAQENTRGRVRLGPGTLYTILAKFLEEELITETEVEGRKRTYRLTEKGREVYLSELDRLRRCIADAEEEL